MLLSTDRWGVCAEGEKAPSPFEKTSTHDLKKKAEPLSLKVLDLESLRRAHEILEEILRRDENDVEALVVLARVCWSIGNHEEKAKDQKKFFKQGMDLSKKLKELKPESAAGWYWYGVNYGEWVDRSSIFSKIGAKKQIVDNMEQVLKLDETYDSGGAYIVLGRINYIAPGGSYEKAIQYYEKAILLGPRRSTAYLFLGELYLHEHIFDKAEEYLKKVMSMEIDPRYGIEGKQDRAAAEKIIKKLQRKEDNFPEQEELTGK